MSRNAPQRCPNPECKRSLADVTVPPKYARHRLQFTQAYQIIGKNGGPKLWGCPHCGHEWEPQA